MWHEKYKFVAFLFFYLSHQCGIRWTRFHIYNNFNQLIGYTWSITNYQLPITEEFWENLDTSRRWRVNVIFPPNLVVFESEGIIVIPSAGNCPILKDTRCSTLFITDWFFCRVDKAVAYPPKISSNEIR